MDQTPRQTASSTGGCNERSRQVLADVSRDIERPAGTARGTGMPELLELLDAVVAQTTKLMTTCRPPESFRLGVGDVQVEVRWTPGTATTAESHDAGPVGNAPTDRSFR